MSVLSVRQLSVVHGKRVVIEPFDWTVRVGEKWALLGVNGSGKSSVLHSLLGLNAGMRTHVTLGDAPLSELSARSQALRRVYVPQRYDEPFTVTVWQALCSVTPDADDARREAALREFGLLEHRNAWLHHLSGGERQRLTWVFANVLRSGETLLALYDEPLSAQDLVWQRRLLNELCAAPHAVIAAVHDLNHVAAFASHVLVFGEGRVVAQGAVADVMRAAVLSEAFGVALVCDNGFWRVS
jgi:iron complex transport system ATP-binding protein